MSNQVVGSRPTYQRQDDNQDWKDRYHDRRDKDIKVNWRDVEIGWEIETKKGNWRDQNRDWRERDNDRDRYVHPHDRPKGNKVVIEPASY